VDDLKAMIREKLGRFASREPFARSFDVSISNDERGINPRRASGRAGSTSECVGHIRETGSIFHSGVSNHGD